MKNKILKFAAILLIPGVMASCMTSYDAYGNPVQSVSPGGAAAMAIGAAAVGAALSAQHQRNRINRVNHINRYPVHYGRGWGGHQPHFNRGPVCHY